MKKMYLEKENCICYNASRQKTKRGTPSSTTAKSPGAGTLGLFYSQFWQWQGLEP